MDYSIQSFLKTASGLIPIEECDRAPTDLDYIEGGIKWTIEGTDILTKAHWDLVDQLWAYVVNGVCELLQTGRAETYFPDQPLLLRFTRLNGNRIEVTVGEQHYIVPEKVFYHSLTDGAVHFFSEMKRLVPLRSETWDELIKRIVNCTNTMGSH